MQMVSLTITFFLFPYKLNNYEWDMWSFLYAGTRAVDVMNDSLLANFVSMSGQERV
jgi:hypothetical protein